VVERNLQISCPRPPRAFIFVELWLRGRQRRADDSGLARIFQQRPGTGTADSFLGACKRLVEQAALQRQPGASLELALASGVNPLKRKRRAWPRGQTMGACGAIGEPSGALWQAIPAPSKRCARGQQVERGRPCGLWMPSMRGGCWSTPRTTSIPMMSWRVRKSPSTRWQPWCERKVTSWFHVL